MYSILNIKNWKVQTTYLASSCCIWELFFKCKWIYFSSPPFVALIGGERNVVLHRGAANILHSAGRWGMFYNTCKGWGNCAPFWCVRAMLHYLQGWGDFALRGWDEGNVALCERVGRTGRCAGDAGNVALHERMGKISYNSGVWRKCCTAWEGGVVSPCSRGCGECHTMPEGGGRIPLREMVEGILPYLELSRERHTMQEVAGNVALSRRVRRILHYVEGWREWYAVSTMVGGMTNKTEPPEGGKIRNETSRRR